MMRFIVSSIFAVLFLFSHQANSQHIPQYDASSLAAELRFYGLKDHMPVAVAPGMLFSEAWDRQNRLVVVVVHYPDINTNPADHLVVAGQPDYVRFLQTLYVDHLAKHRVDTSRIRRAGQMQFVHMYHIVNGARIPQSSSQMTTVAKGEYRIHLRPNGSGGLVGDVAQDRVDPGGMTAGKRSNALEVVVKRENQIDERILESWKKRETIAQERIDAQKAIYKNAVRTGAVYKGYDYWVNFQDPVLMAAILNGDGQGYNLDGILMGWVAAFEAQCSHLLAEDYFEFEDQYMVTYRSRLGRPKSSYSSSNSVRVRKHFAPYVDAIRRNKFGPSFMVALNQLTRVWNGDLTAVFEVPSGLSAPIIDAAVFIRSNGCESNSVQQFDLNLLNALGGGLSVQQSSALDADKSRSESSIEPGSSNFQTISEACWHASMYVATSLKPATPQLCVCEESVFADHLSPSLKQEALSDYPKFALDVKMAKTPEYKKLRAKRYQACRSILE